MLSSSDFAAFFALHSLFYISFYLFTKILPLILSESGVFGQTEETSFVRSLFLLPQDSSIQGNSIYFFNRQNSIGTLFCDAKQLTRLCCKEDALSCRASSSFQPFGRLKIHLLAGRLNDVLRDSVPRTLQEALPLDSAKGSAFGNR